VDVQLAQLFVNRVIEAFVHPIQPALIVLGGVLAPKAAQLAEVATPPAPEKMAVTGAFESNPNSVGMTLNVSVAVTQSAACVALHPYSVYCPSAAQLASAPERPPKLPVNDPDVW